jgi:hypothetical protein
MNYLIDVAPAQPGERLVDRIVSMTAVFLMLAMVGVGVMVAFAGLLIGRHKKLRRLPDAHRLVTTRQEAHPGTRGLATFPDSYRGSADHGSSAVAADSSGRPGGLDSPSWFSNRVCG